MRIVRHARLTRETSSVRRALGVFVSLIASAMAVGVAAQTVRPPQPGPQPGDRVRLTVWREPDLSGDFSVDENGWVVIPKVGRLEVANLSVDSLNALLIARYASSLREPAVQVTVLRRVTVTGEVRNPGLYYVDPTVTVVDVLALAGGMSTNARADKVQLLRTGKRVSVRLSDATRLADLPLRSGDQLHIAERSWLARNTALVSGGLTAIALVFAAVIR